MTATETSRRIEARREALGLSQWKLANRINNNGTSVSETAVRKWCNGESLFNVRFLVPLSQALECHPFFLLGLQKTPGRAV